MLFKPNNSEQRLAPSYYRGCWHEVSRAFLWDRSIPHQFYNQASPSNPHRIDHYRIDHSLSVHGDCTGLQNWCGAFFTLTVVYTPKGFLLHTASLRQTFVHCAIFVTAAPRGGLGSVSVPMWRINLSVPLRVDALVSHYLTNKLIRHRPLPVRSKPLISLPCDIEISFGITCTFANPPEGEAAIPNTGVRYLCITHPFATNLPEGKFVRLACLSHAVSVRSEPGSNSSIFIVCRSTL